MNIVIDGVSVIANEGEYILDIARRNGIFIPAICYLSKCSPTLACKMCMVEIDGKRVYACNTKAKEGMNVVSNTEQIAIERRAIMQGYAINHPLECGVCDKSGECELQDFVHLCGIDSQEYALAPSDKKMDSWGEVKYDPNLCILCERCATACKDNLGEAYLKVVKQDLPAPSSALKESMPKDAFSVLNRAQKGVIGFVGENECKDCAECASVCPVGALGVKSFQYTTNAWELQKVSSTCNLCPSACKIVYESKTNAKGEHRIYRISNDFNFNTICGGGRFGYDIYARMDKSKMADFVNVINGSSHIVVGGNTTNNEARFLQEIKSRFGVKLINPLLQKYRDFMEVLLDSGAQLSKLENIAEHGVLLALGAIKYENPLIRYKINNTLKLRKDSTFIYAHALHDELMAKLSKNVFMLPIAPHGEDSLLLAVMKILDSESPLLSVLEESKKNIQISITKEIVETIEEKVVDENGSEQIRQKEVKKNVEVNEDREFYGLFEESNISYDDFVRLETTLSRAKPLIIVGSDVYYHKNMRYIAKMLGVLQGAQKINVLVIPPSSNANGILQNLELDSALDSENLADSSKSVQSAKKCVGWRARGDFCVDSIECDFEIPYFNALRDSITNLDYKTLPLNPSNPLDKCEYLKEMALALGFEFEQPRVDLPNDYANDGSDERGYANPPHYCRSAQEVSFIECEKCEANAYLRDLSSHFYPYTHASKQLHSPIGIYVSVQKLESLGGEFGIKEGDVVRAHNENGELEARIYVDYDMGGDFFALSPQIKNVDTLFCGARFACVRIAK